MDFVLTTEVTTSSEGLTSVPIADLAGKQPTLYLIEQSAEEQVVWFGTDSSAFPLSQEHIGEALPFLLTFLESGRLVKR